MKKKVPKKIKVKKNIVNFFNDKRNQKNPSLNSKIKAVHDIESGSKIISNAVVLIGFPEHAITFFDSIYENVIKCNNAKVFAHIWVNGYEHVIPKVEQLLKSVNATYQLSTQNRDSYKTDFIKGAWYNQIKEGPLSFPPNVFGQFDSANQVMKMVRKKETNQDSFKWILKSRFDVHFNKPILLDDFAWKEDEMHVRKIVFPWMFQDWSFFGSLKAMSIWGKSFNDIEKLYKKHGSAFNQESLWSKNLSINNIRFVDHPEWTHHLIDRDRCCDFCKSINPEPKPYNSSNCSNDRWIIKDINLDISPS